MTMDPGPWANYHHYAAVRLQQQQQQNSFNNVNSINSCSNNRNNGGSVSQNCYNLNQNTMYTQNQMESLLAHYNGLNQNNNSSNGNNDPSTNFATTFGFNHGNSNPHHNAYDAGFFTNQIQNAAKASINLSAAAGLFKPAKSTKDNFSNAHPSINNNNHQLNSNNLNHETSASFLSHHLPSWRNNHHSNLNINNHSHNHHNHNVNNNSGPFGILPHQTVNSSGLQHSSMKHSIQQNNNQEINRNNSKSCLLETASSKNNAQFNKTNNSPNFAGNVNNNLLPTMMGVHQNLIQNGVSNSGNINNSFINNNVKHHNLISNNVSNNNFIESTTTKKNQMQHNSNIPHSSQTADPYFFTMNNQQMLMKATLNHAQFANQRSSNNHNNSACVITSNSSSVNHHQYNSMNFQKNFMHSQNVNSSCLMSRNNMNNLNTLDSFKSFNNAMVNNTYCSMVMSGIQINNYNVSNHNNLIISNNSNCSSNQKNNLNNINDNSNTNLNNIQTSSNLNGNGNTIVDNLNNNNNTINNNSTNSSINGVNMLNPGSVMTSNSRCSSVASVNNIQQINESSSCSYGFSNSPSYNNSSSSGGIINSTNNNSNSSSSNQNRNLNSSHHQLNTINVVPNNNQLNDFTNSINGYNTNNSSLSVSHHGNTPGLSSTPGYPTPPSSVNRSEIMSQSQHSIQSSQDELMQTNFVQNQQFNVNNSVSYNKIGPLINDNSPNNSSILNNSESCLMNNTNLNNYLNNNHIQESNQNSCLPNLMNMTPISDTMSETSKLNDSQCSSNAINMNIQNHQVESNLNNLIYNDNTNEMDLSNMNLNLNHITNFPSQIQNNQVKKKKEKSKKKKKKVLPSNMNSVNEDLTNNNLFYYQNVQAQQQNAYSNVKNSDNYFFGNMQQEQILQQNVHQNNSMFVNHQNNQNSQISINNQNQRNQETSQHSINSNIHLEQNHVLNSNNNLTNSQCLFENNVNNGNLINQHDISNSICHNTSQNQDMNIILSNSQQSNDHQMNMITNEINEESQVEDKLANLEEDLKFLTSSSECMLSDMNVSVKESRNMDKFFNDNLMHNNLLENSSLNSSRLQSLNSRNHDNSNNSINENCLLINKESINDMNPNSSNSFESSTTEESFNKINNNFMTNSSINVETIKNKEDKNQVFNNIKIDEKSNIECLKSQQFCDNFMIKSNNSSKMFINEKVNGVKKMNETVIKKKKKKDKLKNKSIDLLKNSSKFSSKINISDKNNETKKIKKINKISNDSILLGSSMTITSKTLELPLRNSLDIFDNNKIVNKLSKNQNITITPISTIKNCLNKKQKLDFSGDKKQYDEYEFKDSLVDQNIKKRKKTNCENTLKKKSTSMSIESKSETSFSKVTCENPKVNLNGNINGIIKQDVNNYSKEISFETQKVKCKKSENVNNLLKNSKSKMKVLSLKRSNLEIKKNPDCLSINKSNKIKSNQVLENGVKENQNFVKNRAVQNNTIDTKTINLNKNIQTVNVNQKVVQMNKNIVTGKNINNSTKNTIIVEKSNSLNGVNLNKTFSNVFIGKNINNLIKNKNAVTNTSLDKKSVNDLNEISILNKIPKDDTKISLNDLNKKMPSTVIDDNTKTNFSSPKIAVNSLIKVQNSNSNIKRRSNEKKALTVKEGLMRTGDFVISKEALAKNLSLLWRIEGKSLLQRFEPVEENGSTFYQNTSSYSAWNPTVRQKYVGVNVRIVGCSRNKTTVEKLSFNKSAESNAIDEKLNEVKEESDIFSPTQHENNFQVYIQTLISQALDSSFIEEIIKDHDEYFISHVQKIDDYCSLKKSKIFSKIKWESNTIKCIEIYPKCEVIPQENSGDLRCKFCYEKWSTQILSFTGEPYDPMTLEHKENNELKLNKYAACDSCKSKVLAFSDLLHQKYNFFIKCGEKVEEIRGGDENKESHVILEQCLQDNHWIKSLFKELEDIWIAADKV